MATKSQYTDRRKERSVPNYAHWVKMPAWTEKEVVALMLGRDPNTESAVSPLVTESGEHADLKQLLERAFMAGAFPNRELLAPDQVLSWAKSNRIGAPPELFDAAKKQRLPIKDWRRECQLRDAKLEQVTRQLSEIENAQMRSPDRETVTGLKKAIASLQKLLLALAIDKFKLKRAIKNKSVVSNIKGAVDRAGLSISNDTVRDHLSAAVEQHGENAKFADDA